MAQTNAQKAAEAKRLKEQKAKELKEQKALEAQAKKEAEAKVPEDGSQEPTVDASKAPEAGTKLKEDDEAIEAARLAEEKKLKDANKDPLDIANMTAYNLDGVKQLLHSKAYAIDVKLKEILTKGPINQKFLVAAIHDFMSNTKLGSPIVDDKVNGQRVTTLYRALIKAVKAKGKLDFEINMLILNMAFIAFGEKDLKITKLLAFDTTFTGTAKEYETLMSLVNILQAYCKPANRAAAKKKVSLSQALNLNDTVFSAADRTNIMGYYKD